MSKTKIKVHNKWIEKIHLSNSKEQIPSSLLWDEPPLSDRYARVTIIEIRKHLTEQELEQIKKVIQ